MRWAGHVAHMGERRGFWWGNPKEGPLGRPRHRWENNIKWIFRKWDMGVGTGPSWLRIGTGCGHL